MERRFSDHLIDSLTTEQRAELERHLKYHDQEINLLEQRAENLRALVNELQEQLHINEDERTELLEMLARLQASIMDSAAAKQATVISVDDLSEQARKILRAYRYAGQTPQTLYALEAATGLSDVALLASLEELAQLNLVRCTSRMEDVKVEHFALTTLGEQLVSELS